MKILITGANGLLGQKLIALLQHIEGVELTATGRGINRNAVGNYTYLSADLNNHEGMQMYLQLTQPEVIIHCAAKTQVDFCEEYKEECWRVNVDATQNLLNIAKTLNARFVYISTDFVFDGLSGPYRESDEPDPISYYGRSKHAAEQLVINSGLNYAIVRTVLVYGASLDPSRGNIVLWVKDELENGRMIRVVDDQWRTPTLAEDLAYGIWLVVKKQKKGIFHISGDENMSPFQLAQRVAEFYNLDKKLIRPVSSFDLNQSGKRPPKTGFIIHKAQRELGFRPTKFIDGLEVVRIQLED